MSQFSQGKICFHYREPLFSMQGPYPCTSQLGIAVRDQKNLKYTNLCCENFFDDLAFALLSDSSCTNSELHKFSIPLKPCISEPEIQILNGLKGPSLSSFSTCFLTFVDPLHCKYILYNFFIFLLCSTFYCNP